MNNMLEQYLNMYFLRPENAIMVYRRALGINNSSINWKDGVNMDISCADGVFSFIAAGGEFDNTFDMFINVDEKSIDKLHKNREIDIFNSNKSNYKNILPIIKKYPQYNFSIGTDWKQSLLNKASKLDFYTKLLLQDNNKILDVESSSVDNIYHNSIYWVNDIDVHLKELYRVLTSGGVLLLQIKTDEIINIHPSNKNSNIFSPESLNILDRGRLASWKSIKNIDWWLKKFESIGFQVEYVEPVYTKEQVMIWHYGFRPFAHTFIKMFNKLGIDERTNYKKELVESLFPLVKDLAMLKPTKNDAYEFTIKLVK